MSNIINVLITGDAKGAEAAFDKVGDKAAKSGSSMGKFGDIANKVTAAAVTGMIAVGVEAVKWGSEQEDAQARLSQALKNSGTSYDKNAASIQNTIKANEKYGTTATETMTLLARGTTSTGSLSKATQLLSLAQNVAAGSGKPLADVYIAVTKASEGQLKPLKQLGIDLPVAAGGALKTKTAFENLLKANAALKKVQDDYHAGLIKGPAYHKALEAALVNVADKQQKLKDVQSSGTQILDALSKKFSGQANVAAGTFSGQMKALYARVQDIGAKLGEWLIPKLTAAATWLSKNQGVVKALVVAFGAFVAIMAAYSIGQKVASAGIAAWNAAVKVASAVQWLWNAAVDANPLTLIVIALVALVAGIIIAYKKVGWFRDIINDMWTAIQVGFDWVKKNWPLLLAILTGPIGIAVLIIVKNWGTIKDGVKDIIDWVKKNWPLLLAILTGPIGLAVLAIVKNWDTIKSGFSAVKDWIGNRVSDIVGFIGSIPGRILGFVQNFYNGALALGQHIFNGIKDGVSGAIGAVGDLASQLWGAIKGFLNSYMIDPANSFLASIDILGYHPFGRSTLPRFHQGGIYNAYNGAGEGFAMLRDGEGVFTPEQMRALGIALGGGGSGGGTVNIHLPAGANGADVVREQRRYNKRNGRK